MPISSRRLFAVIASAGLTLAAIGPALGGSAERQAAAVGAAAARRALQQQPVCTAGVDKTAAPAEIKLGQTVTVTLKVDGSCTTTDQPADVILAIDHSSSMGRNGKLDAAKLAAVAFVNRMDPTLVRIGLVSVSGVGNRIQDLTTDKPVLIAAINGLQLERGTNIVDGLDTARRALIGAGARPGVNKVIIFLTDGNHSVNSPPESDLDAVIANVRAAGLDTFTIGLGPDADAATLRRIATDALHYFFSPTNDDLEGIYLQIAGRIQALVLFKTSVLTDVVPANMTYIAGSAAPIAPAVSPDGRTLTWQIDNVKEPGFTLTYRLRPEQAGTWPTNVKAELVFQDGYGKSGTKTFPIPKVKVNVEIPTPTVTPPPIATPVPGGCICDEVLRRVPRHVIDDALANPARYYGWRYPLDPNKPPSHANPPRECLSIMNRNIPYHPLWNTVEWHVGCP